MASGLKATEELLYRLIAGGVGDGAATGLDDFIISDERMSAEARVQVYAGMYFHRLLAVLGEDFHVTRATLGEERFHDVVARYLAAHPPSHFSVSECGRHFAEYLLVDPSARNFPYAPDLARVERAIIDSFHARDAAALDDDAMRSVAHAEWPALRMRTHPATRIVDLKWRVGDLLRAAAEDRALAAPIRDRCAMLVWRIRNQVFYREVDAAERAGLMVAGDGASFSDICAAVADAIDPADSTARVARLLQSWLRDGVLVAD